METLPFVERPLTADERRALETQAAYARSTGAATLRRMALICGAASAVLAVLTLLASDAPAQVVLLFWAVVGTALIFWTAIPERRQWRAKAAALTDGLQTARARDWEVRSSRMVEFEEIEDEGACYAFEVDSGQVVLIQGQQYYATDRFPSDDFSVVQIVTASGGVIDEALTVRGRKLAPERLVTADVKDVLLLPEDLAVLPTSLDGVEDFLRMPTSRP